jgi:hypothetical protein
VVAAACGSSRGAAGGAPSPAPADPTCAITALEDRLLAAPEVSLAFTVESTGAVPGVFTGSAHLRGATEAGLRAAGQIHGAPIALELVADQRAMRGHGANLGYDLPTPPDLNATLLRGLVRLGLIHQLAVLSAGSPPDGVDGALVATTHVEGLHTGTEGQLVFDLRVGDALRARVELWLDDRGLPRRRRQTVSSARGAITVVERYTAVELGGTAAAP